MVKTIAEIIEGVTGKKPEDTHKLVYDSPTETLEPIYFFILDLMNDLNLNPEKLVDNFVSSPGSQHFGEMGQRASIMQQQGAKLLGDINTVLRSILNLIYDLREFKIRLKSYEDLKNSSKKASALLSLKQLWMDKVDIQKGNSSIKAMALGQAGFNTLIDAFLVVDNDSDIDRLDLNQIVKRILKPRIHEFNIWVKESEGELKKRFQIEKTYLKSQVSSLKIYSRWAKPYLKAAQDLEMSEGGRNPALVKMFNSLLLELTILGKQKLDVKGESKSGNFPPFFAEEKFLNSVKETYNSCVLVDFKFRGIPSRTQAGFVVGGRAEITFRGYALTGEEIKKVNDELEKSDLNDALGLIKAATEESLETLKEDIEEYLEDKEELEEKTKKKMSGSNPFLALFGVYNNSKESKEKKKKEKAGPYRRHLKWYEKEYFIPAIEKKAKDTAKTVFEIYKKAHGMAAPPN
ncbi:hypothetical protein COU58_02395 [Candidatus Pacearchaeota archaeon CG10_big_fil_rev_8_21_14_0_10_32_42]|nr:MAG: hypothetical protein COU58_02395 [Candidatus Pacearchaeota archaeon CG10_big_fil_rev_8_21_14_0_10_32_42]